jgi:hypothetical protein
MSVDLGQNVVFKAIFKDKIFSTTTKNALELSIDIYFLNGKARVRKEFKLTCCVFMWVFKFPL